MRLCRAVLGSLALLILSLVSVPSLAQSSNQVAAEALFREARKLLDQGQYEQACEKLAASQKLDPAVGTLLNLGRCYEKLGRTASAWGAYREAAAAAHANGQAERLKSARAAADAVEPNLARLTIVVPSTVSALQPTIERNGQAVPPELWGIAVPIDPGEQTIVARAPDKKPWTTRVSVEPKAAQTVTIAELEADPAAAVASPASAPAPVTTAPLAPETDTTSSSWNTQKTIAVVLAGIGVTGGAVGVIQALKFKSKRDEADEVCPSGCQEPRYSQSLELRDEAKSARTVAYVGGAVGGASLIAAAVLWFTADSGEPDSARLRWQPITTADTWGLSVSRQW
jgi:serine/threonine-protein kinase